MAKELYRIHAHRNKVNQGENNSLNQRAISFSMVSIFFRSVVQYTETVYFYVQFFSRLDMHFSTVRYLIDSRRLMMESEKTTDGEGETTHPPSHSTGSIQNPCRQDQPGRFPSYRRANLFHALVFFLSVALRRRALAVASCRVYSS